jgi:hypothetical protein
MKLIAFCCVALALMGAPVRAQTPDYSVELAPGLYTLTWGNNFGNMGLNVGLSVGDDGLLLVDAQDESGCHGS